MTPDQARFRASDAKHLLENKMLTEAFDAVGSYLDGKALTCDPDNKEMAQRIVLSKQLLAAVRREIYRHVENGTAAEIRIAQMEKRRLMPFFQR